MNFYVFSNSQETGVLSSGISAESVDLHRRTDFVVLVIGVGSDVSIVLGRGEGGNV